MLNLDFQSMGREVSSRWKKTTVEDRKRFDELAKVDAERYKKEVTIWEEEQVLKAKKEMELEESKLAAEEKESSHDARGLISEHAIASQEQGCFSSGANSLFAAAPLRAMEERNHPDGPQRLSPRLAPMAASIHSSDFQNLAELELARRQQLNQIYFSGAMQSANQLQALRNQITLGMMPQSQATLFSGHGNDAMLLERIRQQHDISMAATLSRQRGDGGSGGQDIRVTLNEMLRRREQQEQAAFVALRGVPNFPHGTSLAGAMFAAGAPSPQVPMPSVMHLRGALQQSFPPFQGSSSNQTGTSYADSDVESFLRRLGQTRPGDGAK